MLWYQSRASLKWAIITGQAIYSQRARKYATEYAWKITARFRKTIDYSRLSTRFPAYAWYSEIREKRNKHLALFATQHSCRFIKKLLSTPLYHFLRLFLISKHFCVRIPDKVSIESYGSTRQFNESNTLQNFHRRYANNRQHRRQLCHQYKQHCYTFFLLLDSRESKLKKFYKVDWTTTGVLW